MKQLVFLFIFLGHFYNVSGQLPAIIKDKDGYTNVRKEPNAQSEVIYSLEENEVFVVDEYKYDEHKEWAAILITKNKFSFTSDSFLYSKGYIHKSRISFFKEKEIHNTVNDYNAEVFSFSYQIIPFSKEHKIIEYSQSSWGLLINGLPVWGTDMEIPKTEVVNIDIKIGENIIVVPKILIADIYECSNNFNVYKKDDTYFVQQWNSDGAGGYELIWVINKEGIQQRFIGAY